MEVARAGGLDPTPSFAPGDDPLLAGAISYASLVHKGLPCARLGYKLV